MHAGWDRKREAVCRSIGPAGSSSLSRAAAAGQKFTPEMVLKCVFYWSYLLSFHLNTVHADNFAFIFVIIALSKSNLWKFKAREKFGGVLVWKRMKDGTQKQYSTLLKAISKLDCTLIKILFLFIVSCIYRGTHTITHTHMCDPICSWYQIVLDF